MTVDSFDELLVNESLSIFSFVLYTIKHGWFWSSVLAGIIYWSMRNRMQKRHAVWASVAVPLGLLLFEIFAKLIHEELL